MTHGMGRRTLISTVALAAMTGLFVATDSPIPKDFERASGPPFRLTPDEPVRSYVATAGFDTSRNDPAASDELVFMATALVDVRDADVTLTLSMSDCDGVELGSTERTLEPGTTDGQVVVEGSRVIGCDASEFGCEPSVCIEARSEGDGDLRATWDATVQADEAIFGSLWIERGEE